MQVIEGVTRMLGRDIWNSTIIGLTHGRLTSLPESMAYGARDAAPWPPLPGAALAGRACRAQCLPSSMRSRGGVRYPKLMQAVSTFTACPFAPVNGS
jgi:hypothetical protein